MKQADLNGIELEYEVAGAGEPVLLISPVLADSFLPLMSEPALAAHYQLIRYHRRGWVGSSHTPAPVSMAHHAADAAALLDHLGIRRAHVVGHSSGAAVATHMALDAPEKAHTLALLELTLLTVPSAGGFFQAAAPAFDAYVRGDHEEAFARFMELASGMEWPACKTLLEKRMPGSVAQSIKDADTFFGVELPALGEWKLSTEQAATIDRPVLSVLGADTGQLWNEIAEVLRSSLPRVEECKIDGIGHLLHLQDPGPVARQVAAFLGRNSMTRH